MPLDFLILYEHPVREYESILLLSEELKRRGYSVDIRQLLDRKKLRYFTWKKPTVLVSSCMYDDEAINSHVYNNVGKCDKIVNLHWEQMLSDTQEGEPWFNFKGYAKNCVQTCWGTATSSRLIAHNVQRTKAPVTGALMMDFLRPEFDGYYKTKAELCAEHSLDPDKKIMLYISSFGYASMTDAEVAELSKMAGTDFSSFAEVNRKSMSETLMWFDEYLNQNPDVQLVYRRHPSEWNSNALEALADKYPNFHVIFSSGVQQWITVADCITIWMSSSIAEVFFANKTCHILRPMPIPHEFDPVIYKDASYITTAKQFTAAMQTAAPPFPIAPSIIESYFETSSEPAYICLADLLENEYHSPMKDGPFSAGFAPKFNFLKLVALWGIHILHALRFDPAKLNKISPKFADFAGRIYGYVDKAYIPKKTIKQMREKIQLFLDKQPSQEDEDYDDYTVQNLR